VRADEDEEEFDEGPPRNFDEWLDRYRKDVGLVLWLLGCIAILFGVAAMSRFLMYVGCGSLTVGFVFLMMAWEQG